MKTTARKNRHPRQTVPPIIPPVELGLTQSQVAERTQKGWVNHPVESPTPTVWDIIVGQTCTFFNFIFIVLGGLLLLVGSYSNLLFLLVAAFNTVIGIVQQLRAKRALDKLTLLAQPKATAVRQGLEAKIPIGELVRDDLVVLTVGNQIPADATVVQGRVQVNEGLVTGESQEVEKVLGSTLLSGSFVVAGTCYGVLTAVGQDSYVAQLTHEAKEMGGQGKSEMMAALDRFIRMIAIILTPVGLILYTQQRWLVGLSLRESIEGTVGALVGMIPEGLYLLTSVALAMGVVRLLRKKVLTRDMNSIETLARIDVLCVDKTGTITTPQMVVEEVIPLRDTQPEVALDLIAAMMAEGAPVGNETAQALVNHIQGRTCPWKVIQRVPFTSARKWQGIQLEGMECYLLGAPDWMTEENLGQEYSGQGYRVLLLAQYQGDALPEDGISDRKRVVPLALVRLTNPVRQGAKETFQYFTQQGVTLKVISGDSPQSVSAVAVKAGIPYGERYVDATGINQETLKNLASQYTVFGRVTPQQKKWLVEGLQQQGHTVAMTGDGVNDVLALKEADCGIAMASGSEATCQVANLVLLENEFGKLPNVVNEGRRVVGNITRFATLFVVKNICSLLLALTSLIVGMGYPLEPIQLTLIGWFTIGPPSFLLALEPCNDPVKGRFLSQVLLKAFPGGITDGILGTLILIMGRWMGLSAEEISTVTTLMVMAVGLMVLYRVCTPFDRWRRVVWGAMVTGAVATVAWIGHLFALVPLTGHGWYLLVGVMVCAYPLLLWVNRGVAWLWQKEGQRQHK